MNGKIIVSISLAVALISGDFAQAKQNREETTRSSETRVLEAEQGGWDMFSAPRGGAYFVSSIQRAKNGQAVEGQVLVVLKEPRRGPQIIDAWLDDILMNCEARTFYYLAQRRYFEGSAYPFQPISPIEERAVDNPHVGRLMDVFCAETRPAAQRFVSTEAAVASVHQPAAD